MKKKEVFGTAWWTETTKSGKIALITTQINVGDTKITDLTDEQLRAADIELFDTMEEANKERIKRIMKMI